MSTSKTVTARKDHYCTLCAEIIPTGTQYVYQRITPWDHQDNEGFFTYRAHIDCHALWQKVGDDFDWLFPDDDYEWRRMLADYRVKKQEEAATA